MAELLFINHDVVGTQMAGTGARAVELARVLAREHSVTLAAPGEIDVLPVGIRPYRYTPGDPASLAPALAEAEIVVANGHVLAAHPELAGVAAPLALDLYDPTPLENMALFREASPARRAEQGRRDVDLLLRQLRAGDCLLCATERQRDLYLGALLACGRVTPATADADPTLRGLLRVVPFGLPAEPPQPMSAPWPDLGPGARVILWTGGLWDWMDPLTAVEAMPRVLQRAPEARLVFLAGRHPGNAHPMQMPGRARGLAAELGLLDRAVLFVDRWVPYAERSGALLGADVAVYLHDETLESRYAAVRSRFLDHLWAGLPSVVTDGDAAAELLTTHNLGRAVPPRDPAAVAAALVELLSNEDERRACSERARALGASYTWEHVAGPLLDFCRDPRRMPGRAATPSLAGVASLDEQLAVAARDQRAREGDEARNRALQAAHEGWSVAERTPGGGLLGRVRRLLIDHVVRPFVAPLVEQQNAQNAAVLRALDALAESSDQRRSETFALLDEQAGRLTGQINDLAAEVAAAGRRLDDLEGRIVDLDEADTMLAERLTAEDRETSREDGTLPENPPTHAQQ